MGEIADYHVNMYSSGKWGVPLNKKKSYQTITKNEIKDREFYVVEVIGGNTNRVMGTKLIVCENTETSWWVYASSGVTGISKSVCKTLTEGMSLLAAKEYRDRLSQK